MNPDNKIAETPLMKQYLSVKSKYPEAILLFRVGDFYETFGRDAVIASEALGIVLTKRGNGAAQFVELAGFPHHAIDTYLPKLVRAGYKVAVCDQLEDPKLTKKIVKRGVTELITPGVAMNDQLLSHKENNYLAAVHFSKDKAGIAFADISTGTFRAASGDLSYIDLLLSGFSPKEVLVQRGYQKGFQERFGKDYYTTVVDEWAFVADSASEKLCSHFGVKTLKGFGLEDNPLALTAAGAILYYLELTRHEGLSHISSISRIDRDDYVWIDRFTFRNLEVFNPFRQDGRSLVDVIDKTSSPMGARLLRNWISMPSKSTDEIEKRQDVVAFLFGNSKTKEEIRDLISSIGDMERIVSKAAASKISPREAVQLRRGLVSSALLKECCSHTGCRELVQISQEIDECKDLCERLERELAEDPASLAGKGDIIAGGVSPELDELRNIVRHSKEILNSILEREVARTGINSLKISYNNVFGYYLEVRNTYKERVPSDWIRKQTLVSAERYITQELKDYEEKILGAEEKIAALEQELFNSIVRDIQSNIIVIQKNCYAIARIDVLANFAQIAGIYNYNRPSVNDSNTLVIKNGRHPVIETLMAPGEEYIPNDLMLDADNQQIIILTGPNMSGKSALLRQTALIVLMAQIGSFVPAESASIGITDKIFTRVGASDNISRGESTFMVEMLETSLILHNLSARSLVLLDEIGRGTSTYDGMSIAWAIVEYLHEHPQYRAKTLFATHYHELNDLEIKYPRVKNFHISVKETDKSVIFLRKLLPGGVAHSFGIHVAAMAGMPREVVNKAERVLKQLENSSQKSGKPGRKTAVTLNDQAVQLSFFQLDDPLLVSIRDELRDLDINTLSPLDAFDKLRLLKKKTGL